MNHFSDYEQRLKQQLKALDVRQPSIREVHRSWALFQKLSQLIERSANQEVEFTEWLEHILYHPDLGYYTAQKSVIGEKGDFITAPEISHLFADSLSHWLQSKLALVDGVLVEFGAGNGTLATQLLQRLDGHVTRYYIVEISESLKRLQHENLAEAGLLNYVTWIDNPKQMPSSAIAIGNEVLDAIPAHRFKRNTNQFYEAKVRQEDGLFKVTWSEDLSNELGLWLQQHSDKFDWADYSQDYIFEASPKRTQWLQQWLSQLEQGYCLFIDYGYSADEFFSPERHTGTYQAFYSHRRHEHLTALPGLQDVTSHVNFSEICATLELGQWQLSGFCSQSELILASGVLNDLVLPKELNARIEMSQAIQKLMLPGEMGETVKAIAFSHNIGQNAPSLIPMQLAKRL